MKRLLCSWFCLALATSLQAQTATGRQQVDPFAAPVTQAPAPAAPPAATPAARPAPMPLPHPPGAPAGAQPLLTGLRAILIRDNGQGLLGSVDANALSIAVTNGKPVHIGGHDYQAEVSATAIRLYSGPKGRLVWEGSLGSPAPVSAPLDLSQLKFAPPLSAGVGPGLKSDTTKAAGREPVVTRSAE